MRAQAMVRQNAISLCARITAVALALLPAAPAIAQDWPKLQGGDAPACQASLTKARAAFSSDAFYLYDPKAFAAAPAPALVLAPEALDISGGDALVATGGAFEKVTIDERSRFFWQTKPRHGLRWIMLSALHSWRGDNYELYAIYDSIGLKEITSRVSEHTAFDDADAAVTMAWRPPLMLRNEATGEVWAIDTGPAYIPLDPWRVIVIDKDGAKEQCAIHFRPDVQTATSLLPESVQQLAKMLDGTLGDGRNEGTLNPTSRLRGKVANTWSNAARRPWALTEEPYNSRAEVDAALVRWARGEQSFNVLRKDIYAQYPKAEVDLAAYYRTELGYADAEASALAAKALDLALRTHFIFPHSGQ